MAGTVHHLAGPMVNLFQRCTRCGFVISDYRNATWPIEQGPPRGFDPGEVTVDGNYTMSGATEGAAQCVEQS